jgi:hypothetical protein
VPDRSAPAIDRAAHGILSRPEFRPPDKPLVQRVVDWVGQQLTHLITAAINGSFSLLGLLLLAVVVALLVLLVVRLVGNARAEARAGVTVGPPRRSAEDWAAEALACEGRGDYRGALRARYRALVAELARRGLVEEIPGRTSGEYRRAVSAAVPRVNDDFGGATDLFELAIYGDGPSGAPESEQLSRLASVILESTR